MLGGGGGGPFRDDCLRRFFIVGVERIVKMVVVHLETIVRVASMYTKLFHREL